MASKTFNANSMKYIFYIPNYVPYSNGIKSLWYTAYLFSKIRETKIISFDGGEIGIHEVPNEYANLLIDKYPSGDYIVVYPDMIQGNPLKAKKVARYLMAKPYILNGQGVVKGPNDFLFAFSKAVDESLPQLNTLLPELEGLQKYRREKKGKTLVIYYGKCRVSLRPTKIKEIAKDFDRVKIVTRIIPRNKDALYEEIASASLFVSFDPLSSLAYEANLLGTPALLLDPIFKENFDNFNHKLTGFYYDYKDLEKKDLLKLGAQVYDESVLELELVLKRNESQVSEVVLEIEKWFKQNCKNNSNFDDAAIKFFNDKWNASPIVNCTSIPSVVAYSMMRGNLAIWIISLLAYKKIVKLKVAYKNIINFIKNSFKKIKIFVAGSIFNGSEINIISYILNPNRRRIELVKIEGVKDTVFELDNGFLSHVWRMTCK